MCDLNKLPQIAFAEHSAEQAVYRDNALVSLFMGELTYDKAAV